MMEIPEDDKRVPLLAKWSQSASWIYQVLKNPELAAALPPALKEKGWKLVQDYEKHTSLM